jgi:hypothetical protein
LPQFRAIAWICKEKRSVVTVTSVFALPGVNWRKQAITLIDPDVPPTLARSHRGKTFTYG